MALSKTPLTLPPSACQKGPWSLLHICLPSVSTVIRKNIPDVRPQLTLYSRLPIQRQCQPSQQMLRLSPEVTEPLISNGIRQCILCFLAYCFTWAKNKITYPLGTWFKLNCYRWLTHSTWNRVPIKKKKDAVIDNHQEITSKRCLLLKCLMDYCLHRQGLRREKVRVSRAALNGCLSPTPCSWPTFSAWASSDFKLFVTVFNSSSSSAHLLMFSTRGRKGGRQAKGRRREKGEGWEKMKTES